MATSKKAIATQVDELGKLRAKIKAISDEAAALEEKLLTYALQTENMCLQGKNFVVKISVSDRAKVDYKGLCIFLNPNMTVLKKFTKIKAVTQLRLYPHKKKS